MKKWLSGWFACVAWRSLEQDIIGKEKYLQMVNSMWIDWKITVPLALLIMYIAFRLYHSNKVITID